jgi:hypothetical protein
MSGGSSNETYKITAAGLKALRGVWRTTSEPQSAKCNWIVLSESLSYGSLLHDSKAAARPMAYASSGALEWTACTSSKQNSTLPLDAA